MFFYGKSQYLLKKFIMKKRMKISENQLNLLRSMVEDDVKIEKMYTPEEIKAECDKLDAFIAKSNNELDKYYNIIMFNNIGETLVSRDSYNQLKHYNDIVDSLISSARQLLDIIDGKVEQMPEDIVMDWGDTMRLDAEDRFRAFEYRAEALIKLIEILKYAAGEYEDNRIPEYFTPRDSEIEM
jgi:hypothetical protein